MKDREQDRNMDSKTSSRAPRAPRSVETKPEAKAPCAPRKLEAEKLSAAKAPAADAEQERRALPKPAPIGESTPTLDVPGVVSIPLAEIEITYSRSSGPGGQNVNKVSSKARLRWKLTSGRLEPYVVERFKELYPSWVTEADEVVISSQISRDAPKNRIACLEKLREAIKKAAFRPKKRIPTKPTRGSVLRRLDAKAKLSAKKKDRARKDFD